MKAVIVQAASATQSILPCQRAQYLQQSASFHQLTAKESYTHEQNRKELAEARAMLPLDFILGYGIHSSLR
jgi:hypothetical protein